MPKISKVNARKILDSRGSWTIEVVVELDNGISARASVPQGRSTGSYEAVCVAPDTAVKSIHEVLGPVVLGEDPREQSKIDDKLIRADGTLLKSNLGANAILAVSLASARSAAISEKMPLWKHLRDLFGKDVAEDAVPSLYINVINGGVHAGNNLDFQEYLIILGSRRFDDAVEMGTEIYRSLKSHLESKIGSAYSVLGDEGGFCPDFKDNAEPFFILSETIEKLGLKSEVGLGIDAAAENINKPAKELFDYYRKLKERFNLIYIEDPFKEDDFDNFAKLLEELGNGIIIAGDDLTATNMSRIDKARESKSINGVIIKPNQIGTLTETLEAVRLARKYGWKVIVSHRSGETNDDFIADLAFGVGADGFKLGSPARGERTAKYNRLLEIEKER